MSATILEDDSTSAAAVPTGGRAFGPRWLRGAAVVRILFGVVWAIDASFKWLPGFVNGETLRGELGSAAVVNVPVEHQWLQLWNSVGLLNPSLFAHGIAVVETLVALALILGVFSNVAFIGSALLAIGIWTGAEGMGFPWFQPGQTDVGPSVGYIFASLALFFAAAGATWSIDARLAGRTGRFGWLFSPTVR